jgi:hypothetical protein
MNPITASSVSRASASLKWAASIWYAPVLLGQWIFAAYVVHAYGFPLIAGNIEAWNKHLSDAYVQGDGLGNTAVAAHLGLALIVHFLGPLQLVPWVRRRFPAFHRWNGRAFVVAVIIAVTAGNYMLLTRDLGSFSLKLGFYAQSAFIIVFTFFALKNAMARNIPVHERWATRLFLAASSVWFFRVIIMVWYVTTGGIGINTENATGWFLDAMAALQFLPLLVYEIYLRIKTGNSATAKWSMSAFLIVAALLTTVGVSLATVGMWFPIL